MGIGRREENFICVDVWFYLTQLVYNGQPVFPL